MQDENICTTCGHDKWSHAISQEGVVGACLKETIKGWEYCPCQTFTPPMADHVHEFVNCLVCECGISRLELVLRRQRKNHDKIQQG